MNIIFNYFFLNINSDDDDNNNNNININNKEVKYLLNLLKLVIVCL